MAKQNDDSGLAALVILTLMFTVGLVVLTFVTLKFLFFSLLFVNRSKVLTGDNKPDVENPYDLSKLDIKDARGLFGCVYRSVETAIKLVGTSYNYIVAILFIFTAWQSQNGPFDMYLIVYGVLESVLLVLTVARQLARHRHDTLTGGLCLNIMTVLQVYNFCIVGGMLMEHYHPFFAADESVLKLRNAVLGLCICCFAWPLFLLSPTFNVAINPAGRPDTGSLKCVLITTLFILAGAVFSVFWGLVVIQKSMEDLERDLGVTSNEAFLITWYVFKSLTIALEIVKPIIKILYKRQIQRLIDLTYYLIVLQILEPLIRQLQDPELTARYEEAKTLLETAVADLQDLVF